MTLTEGQRVKIAAINDSFEMGGSHTASRMLGWQISSLRRAAGLTQDELAERVGITRPQLSRIETARHSASVGTVAAVLAALGHRLEVVQI